MKLSQTELDALMQRNPALAKANATAPTQKESLTVENNPKIHADLERRECDLHDQVYTWLTQHQGLCVGHARTDKKCTFTVGWPDLTFAIKGKACAIELKTSNGKLSDEQIQTIEAMTKDGWTVRVCRNLEQVRDFVQEIRVKN